MNNKREFWENWNSFCILMKSIIMDNKVKIIDTKNYVKILEDLSNEGKTVGIPVVGNSMSPFLISDRDYVLFQKPDRSLKMGDIVFFRRDSGEYVLHRIYEIKNDGYYIVGDAQTVIEGPIREDQIFGIVTKAKRKNHWIDDSNVWWIFFEKIWIRMIPLRPFVRHIYGTCSKWILRSAKKEEL